MRNKNMISNYKLVTERSALLNSSKISEISSLRKLYLKISKTFTVDLKILQTMALYNTLKQY